MSKPTLSAGALAALCLLSAAGATCLPAQAAGQEGMVVARDPQTGRLRAPTPEEIRALQAQKPAASSVTTTAPNASSAGTGTHVLLRPDGARGVRLGGKRLVYDVARRGPDGKLTSECVEGEDAAHAALNAPQNSQHKETAHEDR